MDRRPYRWPRGGSAAWLGDESGAALLRSEFFGAPLDLEQTANLSLTGAVTLTGDIEITVAPAGGFASPLMWVNGLGRTNALALSQTTNLALSGTVALTGDIGITGPAPASGGFSSLLAWPYGLGAPGSGATSLNLNQTAAIGIAGVFGVTGNVEHNGPTPTNGFLSPITLWPYGLGAAPSGPPAPFELEPPLYIEGIVGTLGITGDIAFGAPPAGAGGFTSTALLWPFGFGVPVTVRNLVQTSPIGIAGSFTIAGALEGTTPPAATGLVWLRRRRR